MGPAGPPKAMKVMSVSCLSMWVSCQADGLKLSGVWLPALQVRARHRESNASATQACGRMAYSSQLVVRGLREFKARSSDILHQVLDRRRPGNRQDHFGTFE
jgi:hypothetical protein